MPQGRVLSCTLFSLAINGVLSSVPNSVNASLYVDDLLIYCVGSYVPSLERRIQNAVNMICSWTRDHGFSFAASKTNCIHFHRKRSMQPPQKLLLDGVIIPNRTSIRYLGMTIDYKLQWKDHIRALKVDCLARLDLLKCLSHTSWGADRTTLLRVYRAVIRSKLDYGSTIYGCASGKTLGLLDPVHNAALRICTGAYRSSPIASLYAESGEPSLQTRRDQLLLQYLARTLQLPSSAAYNYVQIPATDNSTNPLSAQVSNICISLNLSISTVPFIHDGMPVWQLYSDLVCEDYSYPRKSDCPDSVLRSYFYEHIPTRCIYMQTELRMNMVLDALL